MIEMVSLNFDSGSQPRTMLSKLYDDRFSIDSGYDSILSQSSLCLSSSSSTSVANTSNNPSPLRSLLNTPIKTPKKTTPPPPHQTPDRLSVDMNGLYLASIRSQTKKSAEPTTTSPIRSSHFFNYSASNSNSPVCTSAKKSPKFVNSDAFLYECSDHSMRISKLLKSPSGFSPHHQILTDRPASFTNNVRSFTSRLRSEGLVSTNDHLEHNSSIFVTPAVPVLPKTPTEQEFIESLYRNRHIPSDPRCLIGNPSFVLIIIYNPYFRFTLRIRLYFLKLKVDMLALNTSI